MKPWERQSYAKLLNSNCGAPELTAEVPFGLRYRAYHVPVGNW